MIFFFWHWFYFLIIILQNLTEKSQTVNRNCFSIFVKLDWVMNKLQFGAIGSMFAALFYVFIDPVDVSRNPSFNTGVICSSSARCQELKTKIESFSEKYSHCQQLNIINKRKKFTSCVAVESNHGPDSRLRSNDYWTAAITLINECNWSCDVNYMFLLL